METLVAILNLLSGFVDRVPPSVWGVIIGALSALGTVILTNRVHDRRLREQLAHDRELKNREREMILRKEVYLAGAEAVSTALLTVGQFANIEMKHEKLFEQYQAKFPSLSKINIIAKESTVTAVSNFSGELATSLLRLTARRLPLTGHLQKVATLRALVDCAQKEQTRILELINEYTLEGIGDKRKLDILKGRLDFEGDRGNKLSNKRMS